MTSKFNGVDANGNKTMFTSAHLKPFMKVKTKGTGIGLVTENKEGELFINYLEKGGFNKANMVFERWSQYDIVEVYDIGSPCDVLLADHLGPVLWTSVDFVAAAVAIVAHRKDLEDELVGAARYQKSAAESFEIAKAKLEEFNEVNK